MKVKGIVVEHKGIVLSRSGKENQAVANYRLSVVKEAVRSMQSIGKSPVHIRQAVESYWASI